MFDMKTITDTVHRKINGSPSGIECVFIPLNDNWAIKLYDCEDARDNSYERQSLAADYELGPDVGDKIDLPYDNYQGEDGTEQPQYGYITEIVETLVPKHLHANDLFPISDQPEELQKEYRYWDKIWYDQESAFRLECKKELNDHTGIWFEDDHAWNWGIKNGKMICIDFGEY